MQTRMVSKKGIKFNGRIYTGDALLGYVGQKVRVSQDIAVKSDLLIHDDMDGNYIGLAKDQELWDIMIKE